MISARRFFELIRFDPKEDAPSSQYYWKIFQTFGDRFFVPKLNWAGLGFGSTLFLYRKMYVVFFVMLFYEQVIEYQFTLYGFDRGMAHAYGAFLGNVTTALIFNTLYMRFVKRKEESVERIGLHVRLFYPLMVFLTILFGSMVIQFIGLHWNIAWINVGFNYVVLSGLVYMAILYVYYFLDWRKYKRESAT